jgi:hypothetical protein
MTGLSRRTFVQSVATTVPLLGAACSSLDSAGAAAGGAALDRATLGAMAESVLPSELQPDGIDQTVAAFLAWLESYDPVAEADHGYGTGELAYLPADPAPAWAAQLAALDLEARKRTGRAFAELPADARRDLLERHLVREQGTGFPVPHEAGHVAIGLMAWFYATPAATDLCYRARIGKETCRDLGGVVEQPQPLGEST